MMNKSRSVCIVDDDKIFRFTTEKYLLMLDSVKEVYSFRYVEDALEHIKKNKDNSEALPDVILLDVNLPILDGWDFLKEYEPIKRQLAKPIHIFIVSSSIDERDSEKARAHPDIADYVIKPLNEKDLEAIINKTTENDQPQ